MPAYDVHVCISTFVPLALPWLLPWAVASLIPQRGTLPSENVLACDASIGILQVLLFTTPFIVMRKKEVVDGSGDGRA